MTAGNHIRASRLGGGPDGASALFMAEDAAAPHAGTPPTCGTGPVTDEELRRYALRFPAGWMTLEGVEALVRVERHLGPGCQIEESHVRRPGGGR